MQWTINDSEVNTTKIILAHSVIQALPLLSRQLYNITTNAMLNANLNATAGMRLATPLTDSSETAR